MGYVLRKAGTLPSFFQSNKSRSKKSSGVIPSLEYNNLYYKTDSEKLNLFSNILENTFHDSYDARFEDRHCQFVKTQVSKINWDLSDDNYFSVGDIYGVINRLKVGKSPGDDGSQTDHFRVCFASFRLLQYTTYMQLNG